MAEPFELMTLDRGPGEGVVVLKLVQEGRDGPRPVVVLDGDLIERLAVTISVIPNDARGLVLASDAPRAFVAGADLKSFLSMTDADLDTYLTRGQHVFGQLCDLNMPTAAAIHGATLGGGFELAAHCDLLVGCPAAKPYAIGLPEASLGLCPGWGGTNTLAARMNAETALRLTATGRTLKVDEARSEGIFDAWPDEPASLIEVAAEAVASMTSPDRDGAPSRWIGANAEIRASVAEAVDNMDASSPPAAAVAACVRSGLRGGWHEALAEERQRLVSLRHTDEAKAAIEAFFAKSKK